MCNEAARRIELGLLREDWGQTRIELTFPEGMPNMAPLESVRITDTTVIIRRAAGGQGDAAELVTRQWSWPAPGGKPVYNFRSDGRRIEPAQRCLIPVDSFFEFTDPPPPADRTPAPKRARKTKWRFRLADHDWFCIGGIWRGGVPLKSGQSGEAFAMLTCPPGPDIAPYHDRQVVILARTDWARWLDPATPSAALCQPLPEGMLTVERVG